MNVGFDSSRLRFSENAKHSPPANKVAGVNDAIPCTPGLSSNPPFAAVSTDGRFCAKGALGHGVFRPRDSDCSQLWPSLLTWLASLFSAFLSLFRECLSLLAIEQGIAV